jgi:hypothetical protein
MKFKPSDNLPWSAFKSGGRCAAGFSKENCASETYLASLKTVKSSLWERRI